MKTFKRKCKIIKINSLRNVLIFTLVLIIIITFFLFFKFSRQINTNIIQISEAEVNRITYRFITDRINHNLMNKETLKDILVITKNQSDEILYVDFNYDQAYKILDSVSKVLTDSLDSLENGSINIAYYDEKLSHQTNGLVLSIPIGSVLKNAYFYNLGPKVPVKVNYIGSVLTNLQTKITNYGLNNALVEVFVYIEFNSQILAPFGTKNMNLKYDAVIASMMIQGKVPSFYSGEITKNSEIYSKTIE